LSFLERVRASFENEGLEFALVGGFAVALHGAPRGTVDIDCIIAHRERDFVLCERALDAIGLKPRIPVTATEVFQFREEYIKKRNLIAWSFINHENPIEILDVIITLDLRKVKTVTKRLGLEKIKIIALGDLISMKKQSGRPQDLEDIKALEALRAQNQKR
jgi:hypothetical protein